jgi:uncharacterized protein
MRLRDRRRPAWVVKLRDWLPRPHHLRESRAVAWLGPALHHPRVWHLTRRGVALGVAVGIFFGLLVPVGQIVFAAAAAVVLRANLPVAAVSTLVTNPFTFAPVYFAAYRLGQWLLGGEPVLTEDALARTIEADTWWLRVWVDRMVSFGRPLLLGLSILAVGLSVAAYFAVDQLWRLFAWRAWRRRREPEQGE